MSPDYKINPSLLDKFQRVLDAKNDFESFFNEDTDGGYKMSYDEVLGKAEKELLDSINRVPHHPIEAADKGTAFNELIDCLVNDRPSTNPNVSIESTEYKDSPVYRCTINGFEFLFDKDFADRVATYFADCTPQFLTAAKISVDESDVELYGYVDELRENIVYDIKTTKQYEFGKFANHWQHVLYPFCLIESRMMTEVKEFEYTIFVLSGGSSKNPVITGTQYRERYDYDHETARAKLTEICKQFITWVYMHRSDIYNFRIFGMEIPKPQYMIVDVGHYEESENEVYPYTNCQNLPRLTKLDWEIMGVGEYGLQTVCRYQSERNEDGFIGLDEIMFFIKHLASCEEFVSISAVLAKKIIASEAYKLDQSLEWILNKEIIDKRFISISLDVKLHDKMDRYPTVSELIDRLLYIHPEDQSTKFDLTSIRMLFESDMLTLNMH